ncbi:MAG: hypothetical protein V4662_12065 [Verrucomicrobiota bacterium]
MSRLARIGSNPTLRSYMQGAAKQAIAPIHEFLSPTVGVPTMTGYIKSWNAKTGLVIPSTRRSLKGEATMVGFDTSDTAFKLNPNALDFPVDKLEEEDEGMMSVLEEGADITAQLAALASMKEAIDLALVTLGSGTDYNKSAGGADVVNAIDTGIRAALLGAGGFAPMMEIRILWGFGSWQSFKNHSSVRGRFTSGKKESSQIDFGNIDTLFVTPVKHMMATAVYDSNGAGKDAVSKGFMLDNSLVIFATSPAPTRYDTSFMKTLRLRGAYMTPRFYEREDKRVEVAGFDWNEQILAANSGAGYRLNWTDA